MPISDLRESPEALRLRPFAHFDVLSAMHFPHPEDSILRQKFSDILRIENGIRPLQFGKAAENEVRLAFTQNFFRGSIVGYLFNALLEQAGARSVSMNKAIASAQDQLPKSPHGGKADGFSPGQDVELHRRSPRKLRSFYRHFKSVAHLWGAYIHGEDRANSYADINMGVLPSSLEKLPLFLAYAEAHLSLYRELPIKTDDVAFIGDPWNFIIPENLQRVVIIGPR